METHKSVIFCSLLFNSLITIIIANADDAYHPIRYAFTEQATKEASSLLLGSLPEI
jgi:hypothetical protein